MDSSLSGSCFLQVDSKRESLPLKVPLDGKSPVQVSSTAGLTLASLSRATLAAGNDFFILQVQGLNGLSSLDFLQETKTELSGAEIKGGAHLLWPPNAGARVRNPFPQCSHQCEATGARSGRHTGKPLQVLKDSLFNIFFFFLINAGFNEAFRLF